MSNGIRSLWATIQVRDLLVTNDTNTSTMAADDQEAIIVTMTAAPTDAEYLNLTETYHIAELVEEEHVFDALSALALNVTMVGCLLLAYFVKKHKIYCLTERYVTRLLLTSKVDGRVCVDRVVELVPHFCSVSIVSSISLARHKSVYLVPGVSHAVRVR
jgi:hypothetical protein